jgi:hypothetical protein
MSEDDLGWLSGVQQRRVAAINALALAEAQDAAYCTAVQMAARTGWAACQMPPAVPPRFVVDNPVNLLVGTLAPTPAPDMTPETKKAATWLINHLKEDRARLTSENDRLNADNDRLIAENQGMRRNLWNHGSEN